MIVHTSAKVGIAGFLKPPLGLPSGGFFVFPPQPFSPFHPLPGLFRHSCTTLYPFPPIHPSLSAVARPSVIPVVRVFCVSIGPDFPAFLTSVCSVCSVVALLPVFCLPWLPVVHGCFLAILAGRP